MYINPKGIVSQPQADKPKPIDPPKGDDGPPHESKLKKEFEKAKEAVGEAIGEVKFDQ